MTTSHQVTDGQLTAPHLHRYTYTHPYTVTDTPSHRQLSLYGQTVGMCESPPLADVATSGFSPRSHEKAETNRI